MIRGQRYNNGCDRNNTSSGNEQPERSVPQSSSRQGESPKYSSKWISAVAACISAQPSLFSVLYSPTPAVLTPINPLTNVPPNPLLFSSASSSNVGRVPLSTLSNFTNSRISGPAAAKNSGSRKNKENNTLQNAGSVSSSLMPPCDKHVDRYCGLQKNQKDSPHFYSSDSAVRSDQGSTELEELRLRVSSQKCPKCSVEFFTHADLLFHMSVHEADKQGESGSMQNQKGTQNDADLGDSRNKCAVCSRVFTRSWLLKGHMRTHTGERPFRCTWPQCQRAFADKSNLRSHMLIHTTTAKSFTCPKCFRAFSQKRYLHKHMLEVCRII
ncbi:hypothetical protein ACOMHN_027331 [Nucella lapillus]